ncbi:uncharacterized protein LOC127281169 isoform X2 [Leptopilina boulardi]|uniref:uncharacterized protein LOC127281169 isoform X2 n=1 Tax=Leptopilina boulardi TaxID=63433 RepID=UPI0021F61C8D|nr:uncharacterized protein LOC127281169 isoform X2 [Leptopilina boulardi]XP_051160707.1 uncharacterized protein LOC127281169 isoform X2 [Leptopilina boulardi]XP_051160708.1 uncharacterized protein LOC127281169 isoform X2 [Leptopilina boulardi]XP_051160709.1 uncharacterized protein LOC127281169 isoform X2 [Leptopilina boulardi]XP_051160710.1 uncharacterized protein LOC127281169 isoform X2 [Leptopilina boulardi]
MENTTNLLFLSVCHYITYFGIFFYNNHLITLEERYQTVSILNNFFEYLNNSNNNESELKLKFLQNALKESNSYGGRGKNYYKLLDAKHVNEIYQNIIGTTLFFHYGNVNGYLAQLKNGNDKNITIFKENVYQHLLHNYTSRDYCFSSLRNQSIKLTLLAIKKIFKHNILPLFSHLEENVNLDYKRKKRETSDDDDNDDDHIEEIPKKIPKLSHEPQIMLTQEGSEMHKEMLDLLRDFKIEGISFSMRNSYFKQKLYDLAVIQSKSHKDPIGDLWCVQTTNSETIANFLFGLKRKLFHFNDVTLLQREIPTSSLSSSSVDNNNELEQFSSSKTIEIRYHLKIDKNSGIIDLYSFSQSNEFQDEYITFNDRQFCVKNTFFTNHRKILNIELINFGQWPKSMKTEITYLDNSNSIVNNERMERVKTVANFFTQNIPLFTIMKAEDFLMNFILRINTMGDVPSYDQFAKDYYDNLEILPSYKNFEIENKFHIKDVIFYDKLDYIYTLEEANKKIKYLYGSHYILNVKEIFENYKLLSLHWTLRFEDYYTLYFVIKIKAQLLIHFFRYEAAVYRLGLRQCSKSEAQNPIRLYKLYILEQKDLEYFESVKNKNSYFKLKSLPKFYINFFVAITQDTNLALDNSEKKRVILEITLKNQAAIVNINFGGLYSTNPFYIVTSCLFLKVADIHKGTTVTGEEEWFIKLHDNDMSEEKRMVCMAKKLVELFSNDV